MPWIVAETVALRVATLQPRRVAVVPADARLRRAVGDASAELALDVTLCDIAETPPVDLLVWVSSSSRPTAGARIDLLEHVARSVGDVVICERVVSGHGLGAEVLSRIDPGLRRLATDEIEDEELGARARKPWEPPTLWVVAEAAAWRFLADAEMTRTGFCRRLDRMSAAQMVMTCRRILSRFDTAHELLLLALDELLQREDADGIEALRRELRLHPHAPRSITRRAAERVAAMQGEPAVPRVSVAV